MSFTQQAVTISFGPARVVDVEAARDNAIRLAHAADGGAMESTSNTERKNRVLRAIHAWVGAAVLRIEQEATEPRRLVTAPARHPDETPVVLVSIDQDVDGEGYHRRLTLATRAAGKDFDWEEATTTFVPLYGARWADLIQDVDRHLELMAHIIEPGPSVVAA